MYYKLIRCYLKYSTLHKNATSTLLLEQETRVNHQQHLDGDTQIANPELRTYTQQHIDI